jgi:CBS domain containing-hemolysin-like protein
MVTFIIAIVFLLLALAGETARKTYYYVPALEMKRQAEAGDAASRKLYPAVSYGSSLRALLWLFISLTAAVGVVLLSQVAPLWLGIIAVVLLLWIFYSWLPASKVTGFGIKVTSLLNPAILWLLNWLHPALSRSVAQISKRYSAESHTGLYEKTDLLELIERQQKQPGGRFTSEELNVASNALRFNEHKIRDILTARSAVKTVSAHDTLGPIVIDELHKTEQPFALVSGNDEHDIVGTLAVHELGIQSTGKVRDHMQKPVHFLHENDSLAAALHAYYATNSSFFVVVNNHEEYVGIVTIQAVLNQLLGPLPSDDFEEYNDRLAVARRHDAKANLEDVQDVADQLAGNDDTPEEDVVENTEETDEVPEDPDEPDDTSFVDGPAKIDLSDPEPAQKTYKEADIETVVLDDDSIEPENEPDEPAESSEAAEDDDEFESVEEEPDSHPAPRNS